MKSLRFGLEVEMEGLSVEHAQAAVDRYFDSAYDHLGRRWLAVEDASVAGFELNTPPIWYADLGTVQELFRELRLQGARRAHAAGVHVHVDLRDFSVQQLRSLLNLYASYSRVLVRLLNVYTLRRNWFCQSVEGIAALVERDDPRTVDELSRSWYAASDATGEPIGRTNSSRYTELNFNSYFTDRTIEFRAFNSTNHAGKLRAIVVLALALVERAKTFPAIIPLAIAPSEPLDAALTSADRLFSELGLHTREFTNVRAHFVRNVYRAAAQSGTSRTRSVYFQVGHAICDGGSYAEVLDEVLETGVFSLPEVQSAFAAVRKRVKPGGGKPEKPAFAESSAQTGADADEAFAARFLKDLQRRGVGRLWEART